MKLETSAFIRLGEAVKGDVLTTIRLAPLPLSNAIVTPPPSSTPSQVALTGRHTYNAGEP